MLIDKYQRSLLSNTAAFPWTTTSENTYEEKCSCAEGFFVRFLAQAGKLASFTIITAVEFRVHNIPREQLETQPAKHDEQCAVFKALSQRANIQFGERMDPSSSQPGRPALPLAPSLRPRIGPSPRTGVARLGSVEPLTPIIELTSRELNPTYSLRTALRLSVDETSAVITAYRSQSLTVTSA